MFRASLPPVLAPALALGLIAGLTAHGAKAADYLRGSYAGEAAPRAVASEVDWAGFYAGVHAGTSVNTADLRSMADPLANATLPNSSLVGLMRNTIAFKEVTKMGPSFGGFVGINWLWDDVVLGLEADYTRSNTKTTSTSGPYGRLEVSGTDEWAITSTSQARATVSDRGTLRARAGWAAGMFMPFVTAGVAFGNVDSRATTSGEITRTDISNPPTRIDLGTGNISGRIGKRSMGFGSAVGAGIDMQIMPGMFLRAEYQNIQLKQASGVDVTINTGRVAGGVKF